MIELAVVLAVLVTLAALQLTWAATPKSRSALMVCQNNLRQLTAAWLVYAHDNGDRLVGNLDGGDALNAANSNRCWYVGSLDFNAGNSANTNLNYLRNSQLGRYVGPDLRVFKCPADRSAVAYGGKPVARVRSVSMNSYMGERTGPYTSGYRQFKNLSEIVQPTPSEALVFLDEREDSINDGWFAISMSGFEPRFPNAETLVDYPADYHDRGANVSFVDGHVETWHWRDRRTTPPHRRGQLLALAVATPNNPDVERLQAAASRKIRLP